jgi:antitoxin component of RelBE/YafQ-DinJ toxin-antitoxin module
MLIGMAEKKAILNLRIEPSVLAEFKLAAKLRGASMSGLLHQFIARTIREEKAEMPHEFRVLRVRKANGKIAPGSESRKRKTG